MSRTETTTSSDSKSQSDSGSDGSDGSDWSGCGVMMMMMMMMFAVVDGDEGRGDPSTLDRARVDRGGTRGSVPGHPVQDARGRRAAPSGDGGCRRSVDVDVGVGVGAGVGVGEGW